MNFEKWTIEEGRNIYLHCKRERGQDCRYGNEKIDPERTDLNSIKEKLPKTKDGVEFLLPDSYGTTMAAWLEASEKASEKDSRKKGRKVARTAKCLVSVVFTLPSEYQPSAGVDYHEWYTLDRRRKENELFNSVMSFLLEKFSFKDEKLGHNFFFACVHRDETRPHMHVGFIPVVRKTISYKKRIKKGSSETRTVTVRKGTISACEVITQTVLRSVFTKNSTSISERQFHGVKAVR